MAYREMGSTFEALELVQLSVMDGCVIRNESLKPEYRDGRLKADAATDAACGVRLSKLAAKIEREDEKAAQKAADAAEIAEREAERTRRMEAYRKQVENGLFDLQEGLEYCEGGPVDTRKMRKEVWG